MKNSLSTLAGIAAITSGTLFVLIQFMHPPDELASVATSQWFLAHVLTFVFSALALPGFTGIYLRQAQRSRWLGFVGYVALVGAFLLMTNFAFYEAFIAPGLVASAPDYVADGLSILDGGAGPLYLGSLYQLNGALYLIGGVLFAAATLRAGVFPRWAGGTLLAGLVFTLSAAAFPVMARPSAAVFGIGFALLGMALILDMNGPDLARGLPGRRRPSDPAKVVPAPR